MGNRMKIFMRRLRSGSVKRMLRYTALAAREAGRNPIPVFFDVVYCIFRYGVGYQDYRIFGFARRNAEQRKTYFTYGHNVAANHLLNDRAYKVELDDKSRLYRRFHAYLGRQWLDLREATVEEFSAFCRGRSDLFVKVIDQFGGEGAGRIRLTEDTDLPALYEGLKEKGQYLVEELIVQHPHMSELCSDSVNTLRIATVTVHGQAQIAYATLRMGRGGAAVDNICAGGIYTKVDEDGVVRYPGFCNLDACYYEAHPVSGTPLVGFRVPFFEEALEMCKRAAQEIPELGYVGWDVAITENGPVLVEGNNFPSYDFPQNWKFCPDGVGLLPKMERLAGQEITRS